MSFESREQANRLFKVRDFSAPAKGIAGFSEHAIAGRTPAFLVRRESAIVGWWASVSALCTQTHVPVANDLKYVYRDASLSGFRTPKLGLANSFLVHCALIGGLLYIPYILPPDPPKLSDGFQAPEVIFYPVPARPTAQTLPQIAPKGKGGHPGSGIRAELPPAAAKTISNGALTAISKPLHPDSVRQTIIQPASPPDVHIQADLRLPNISLGTQSVPKAPSVSFDLHFKKPADTNANLAVEPAPSMTEDSTDVALMTTLQPTDSQPKLAIPSSPLAKPIRGDFSNSGALGQAAPDFSAASNGRSVLVIGVDPSGTASEMVLPPGNRAGDFVIAPSSAGSGAPGGKPSGATGGGSGGKGSAGDESVGIGPGRTGGGGGDAGYPSAISIKGTGSGTPGIGIDKLDDHFVASMVYLVPGSGGLNLRRNHMVVSAGPVGGGGLSVYRALPCGKIDTIFLPMAGASWTMQYCQKAGAAVAAKADNQSTVIHLDSGIVPPDPDMQSRFDFKRLKVPPGKEQQLIVLRGTLHEDGTVDGLEVFQGVVPQMDEAARLAFSRWKFKPALREGKPVALDILVGIPTEAVVGGEVR